MNEIEVFCTGFGHVKQEGELKFTAVAIMEYFQIVKVEDGMQHIERKTILLDTELHEDFVLGKNYIATIKKGYWTIIKEGPCRPCTPPSCGSATERT